MRVSVVRLLNLTHCSLDSRLGDATPIDRTRDRNVSEVGFRIDHASPGRYAGQRTVKRRVVLSNTKDGSEGNLYSNFHGTMLGCILRVGEQTRVPPRFVEVDNAGIGPDFAAGRPTIDAGQR